MARQSAGQTVFTRGSCGHLSGHHPARGLERAWPAEPDSRYVPSGGTRCLFMILFSVVASVILTVLLNVVLR